MVTLSATRVRAGIASANTLAVPSIAKEVNLARIELQKTGFVL
jgi:hypothetical protein